MGKSTLTKYLPFIYLNLTDDLLFDEKRTKFFVSMMEDSFKNNAHIREYKKYSKGRMALLCPAAPAM